MMKFDEIMSLKLSKEDKVLLQKQAYEQRLPLSTYVRNKVLSSSV